MVFTVFEKENEWQEYCNDCKGYQKIGIVKRKCIDCHKSFDVDARNMTKKRCDECYEKYRKERKLETQRLRRKHIK